METSPRGFVFTTFAYVFYFFETSARFFLENNKGLFCRDIDSLERVTLRGFRN